jgi:hypothetical protein
MTYRYVPPRFELYEFDDESFGPRQHVRREFHSWNGLVNEPAEEVSLAWSLGDAAALVATARRPYDTAWARLSAAHLALSGNTLPIPTRPTFEREVQQEIERIATSVALWSPGPAIVPAGSPADLAVCDGFSLAYSQVGSEMVLVAAVNIRTDQFRVRKVRDWSAYDFDATQSHLLSDLSR